MSPCHFKDLDITFYSFYKSPRWISTTFKVAVSHFLFSPCGALYKTHIFMIQWAGHYYIAMMMLCQVC